ncbi:hypothetical protein [Flagellimonas sp. CMM7]|uniref:hypothetical protein n=1 Tax=Flagellimonas sp. CMM7 TaxID=2654676 RepID=UPI001F08A57E|nr:hypothetical protein [Flagellimonas sp. CMM7]
MSKQVICFLVVIFMGLYAHSQNFGKLRVVTDIPSSLKESSGITIFDQKSAWMVEDSGNHNKIYKVDFKGKIVKELTVKDAKNHDWEDLAKDKKENLYIGDFGNNLNGRKNLVIFKLPNPEVEKGDKITSAKIEFEYPQQKKFPPKKSKRYYDTEAFFHWGNSLYIITKNRTRPYDGKAMIYKVPDKKGKYKAELISEWFTCSDGDTCSITSADISSDGKTIAVLGYGLLWLITDFEFDDFSRGNIQKIDLGIHSQLESVCFLDGSTLLLSDERSNHQGGNLYRLDIGQP